MQIKANVFLKKYSSALDKINNYKNAVWGCKRLFSKLAARYPQEANSKLDHMCALDISGTTPFIRLSSIICTIGPSSSDLYTLQKMIERGMNIARLNFSHGSHEYHANTIKNIRLAVQTYKEKHGFIPSIPIALDTKGPEIRTGLLKEEKEWKSDRKVELKKGNTAMITVDSSFYDQGTESIIFVSYANITRILKPGNRIFLDNGLISLIVKEVEKDHLMCIIENGGFLGSRKGVNLPGIDVDLPAVTEKDKVDIKFGVEQGVDIILASFTRDAAAVGEIRNVLGKEGKDIKIISKIENNQGWVNLDEIIEASDGIMVARGDLGIEIPPEKVFLVQKSTIARCNKLGKPVICATQMLESMITKPRPTRAEVSDVANAILDGADCVMLSGETAQGQYPLECVSTMADICVVAEDAIWHKQLFKDLTLELPVPLERIHALSVAAVQAARKCKAAAIITTDSTGKTACLLAKYRPPCPILSVTRDPRIARHIMLYRGVFSVVIEDKYEAEYWKEVENRIRHGIRLGVAHDFIKWNNTIVVVSGSRRSFIDTIQMFKAEDVAFERK